MAPVNDQASSNPSKSGFSASACQSCGMTGGHYIGSPHMHPDCLFREHERLREAAQAFVDAALNPFDSGEQEFARLRAVLADTTTGSEGER